MNLTVAAVGRIRGRPEEALAEHYRRRIRWPLSVREVEERRKLPALERIAREAALLRGAVPAGATLVALDERGRALASRGFAERLTRWREAGTAELAFLIGGADGLAEDLKAEAALRLAFGPATWPHFLVRVMLLEQIYRAQQIAAGHPYHRD